MEHAGQGVWLKDVLVFLFAAGVVVPALHRARTPAVLGFLLAGIALGPHGLGALAERWSLVEYVTISEPEAVEPFAELGVLFLLFLLGLELSFKRLWSLRRAVFGAGALQAGLSAAAIGFCVHALGMPGPTSIVVGLALALSSTAIVMQLMADQRRTASPTGRATLSVLLFQDILVAPILIVVSVLAQDSGTSLTRLITVGVLQGLGALAIIGLVGRFALRPVFGLAARTGGRDFLMALTLLTVVGAALLTAGAGLSLALGAFLAGLLLGETEFKHQAEIDLEPFKGLLLSLFFMTVGMSLDLNSVMAYWPTIAAGLLALFAVKAVIAGGALRLFAGSTAVALEGAFLLAPAGEFAFVVASSALASGVIDQSVATILVAIAGLSMLLTPFFAIAGRRAARIFEKSAPADEAFDASAASNHVIIAGFGRVGQAIARILESEGTDIIALDRSGALVSRERERGSRVYLGDASRPEFLTRMGAEHAALVIVTVDDPASAKAMVRAVRSLRAGATILARARDTGHAEELKAAGANFVIPEAIEAGLQIAARALEEFGYASETVRDRIASEREAEYRKAENAEKSD